MHNTKRGEIAKSDRDTTESRRILIVAPQPFFSDRGTPIAILQVIRALRELAYDVDVLTYPIGENLELPGVRIFRSSNPFRVRHVKIGFSWRKLVLDITLIGSLFRLVGRQRYCCIHAVEESAFPAAFLCRRLGLPLIYDMQSSMPEQMNEMAFFGLSPIQTALRAAERWILGRANVTACSLGLKSYIHAINPHAHVQEWWFPGQQFPAYAHQVTRIREEFGIENGSRVVLYCGTFEPYQGLEELIKAAPRVVEQVPDTIFLLVGDNEDNPYTLTSEGRQLQAAGQLRIVPRQPSEMIPSFYDVADVMVSPRANGSNIPLKVFDYMTSGRPIVATDIPAHREVLSADRAELVAPTASALAGAITGLLLDREKSSRLGAAAQAYSEQRLGWPRFSNGVKTIYDKALEGVAIDSGD